MYKEIIFIENYFNIKDLFIIIFGYTFVYCINIGYGMHCGLGDGVGGSCSLCCCRIQLPVVINLTSVGVIIFILTKYEVSWLPVCKGLYWSWYTDNVIVEIRFRMSQFLFCTHKMPIMDSGVERAIYWATKWTRVISEWKTGQFYGHIKLQD